MLKTHRGQWTETLEGIKIEINAIWLTHNSFMEKGSVKIGLENPNNFIIRIMQSYPLM